MTRNPLVVFLSLSLVFHEGCSIVCTNSACAATQCAPVEVCTGKNEVVKQGGFCNCCTVCVTILHENEDCPVQIFLGSPPPNRQCAQGLVCYQGKCRRAKDVPQQV